MKRVIENGICHVGNRVQVSNLPPASRFAYSPLEVVVEVVAGLFVHTEALVARDAPGARTKLFEKY